MKAFLLASAACAAALAVPALAQGAEPTTHDHMSMPGDTAMDGAMPDHTMSGHTMPGHDMAGHDMAGHAMTNHDAVGPMRPMASGTGLLPGDRMERGLHWMAGDWMLMAHGYAWGVYTGQGGPRGGKDAFVASMAMIDAQRPIGDATRLKLRTMLSLEPLMGDRGYPNLFATGETAGGRPLVDRQHPHDLFMELSARIDTDIAPGTALFLYGGLPGEPALGPSAFMHRASARFNPEAPITHHWFDSTHISFGVVTVGATARRWQIEASAFNGREPDEQRWDIEARRLDSWAVRVTWLPSPSWQAQASYGHLKRPERLHPDEDEGRFTASVAYASRGVAVTAGYSHKDRKPGRSLGAGFVEANWDVTARHALFGRIERVTNDELFGEDDPLHHDAFTVTKATLGYACTLPLGRIFSLSIGGSASVYGKPGALDGAYGRRPVSGTMFAKLALGR